MHKRRLFSWTGAACVACVLFAGAPAHAQSILQTEPVNAQTFFPNASQLDFLITESSKVLTHRDYRLSLFANYAKKPLEFNIPGRGTSDLVDDQLTLDLIGAVGLWDRVQLGLALPVNLFANVRNPDTRRVDGTASLGDTRLSAKVAVLDRDTAPVGVAAFADLSLPTGRESDFLGADTVEFGFGGAVDYGFAVPPAWIPDEIVVGANLGFAFRKSAQLPSFSFDDVLTYSFGANVPLPRETEFLLDMHGRTVLEAFFENSAASPLEIDVAARHAFDPRFLFVGGLGFGATQGVGTPSVRLFAGVTYRPEAMPKAAPPAPAPIRDAVVDAEVVDRDRRQPVSGARVQAQAVDGSAMAAVADGAGLARLQVAPGPMILVVDAAGFRSQSRELVAEPGGNHRVAFALVRAPRPATLVVTVTTPDGKSATDATVRWRRGAVSGPVTATAAGRFRTTLAAGGVTIAVRGAPRQTTETTATLQAGGRTEVALVLPEPRDPRITVRFTAPDGATVPNGTVFVPNLALETSWAAARWQRRLPAGSYRLAFQASGYFPATAMVSLRRSRTIDVTLEPQRAGVVVTERALLITEQIQFDTGSSHIAADSAELLDEIAAALEARPDVQIRVEGHTDSVGGRVANLRLSQARAQAVRDALIERGIAADRLTAVGYGPDQPLASNDTAEGRAQNRRVEFAVIGAGETP